MRISLNEALNMGRNPHLSIGYLLKKGQEDLEFKFYDWIRKKRY